MPSTFAHAHPPGGSPSGCTVVLHPDEDDLAFATFAQYKNYIRQTYTETQLQNASGFVSTVHVIKIINDAIRYVLQRSTWASAFDHNGYGQQQRHTSSRVLRALCSTPSTPLAA